MKEVPFASRFTALKAALASAFALAVLGAHAQTTAPITSGPQAATAAAQPDPEPSPFSANIALTTKYKFRGQDQGRSKWFSPALQGGFDYSKNGFYIGNWNSNISFTDTSLEMDFYGGYRGEITKELSYDVGVLQYYYPGSDGNGTNFNTTELYGAISWQWLTVKYSHTVSKDYFGLGEIAEQQGIGYRPKGRNTGYIEGNAGYPLIDKLTLNAHLGYTRLAGDLRDARSTTVDASYPSFYDYRIGVTYDLGSGFAAAAAVAGASERGFYGDINKPRVILTLSKTL